MELEFREESKDERNVSLKKGKIKSPSDDVREMIWENNNLRLMRKMSLMSVENERNTLSATTTMSVRCAVSDSELSWACPTTTPFTCLSTLYKLFMITRRNETNASVQG